MSFKLFQILTFSLALTSCHEHGQRENKMTQEKASINMNENNFEKVLEEIKISGIYENLTNWEARGLNPSDESVILTLREATNNFLDKLEKIIIRKTHKKIN